MSTYKPSSVCKEPVNHYSIKQPTLLYGKNSLNQQLLNIGIKKIDEVLIVRIARNIAIGVSEPILPSRAERLPVQNGLCQSDLNQEDHVGVSSNFALAILSRLLKISGI